MMGTEVILILLMAVGLVVFIGEPLVRRDTKVGLESVQDQEIDQLTLQKETLYTAIRDLDFDYHTGKVDENDYTSLRHQLEGEAIETLRALDQADPLAILDDELEREIAALRQSNPLESSPSAMTSADLVVCTYCETPLIGGENFCPACGQAV